jgi:CDP-6-deoxy-D-xylo-4-hexulose-3-dehydrase
MWKLMHDNAISIEDRKKMSDFLLNNAKLTYGEKVKEFETKWSEWLGVKHSVFVNSGSSANLILVQATHDLYGQGNWAAQSCTWATNVSPIMQLQKNSALFFTDVEMQNLGPKLEELEYLFLNHNIKYLFVTHVLGMSAISHYLLELCHKYNVKLFEDCCESHGTIWNNKKVGTYGLASTFSFFYGHHMTTIEGGMVCTNDDEMYEQLLLLRSHGMLRELPPQSRSKRKIDDIDERFTFLCSGYNVRNTELHAVLGIEQIPRLEKSVKIRNDNFITFVNNIDKEKYYSNFNVEGSSLYAFPIICLKAEAKKVKKALDEHNIENRPLIAGNLLRHPMIKNSNTFTYPNFYSCVNANLIHDKSFYVGNNETISEKDVLKLCNILNKI